MTYDLRRLRLRGIIERISKTHRYRLTPEGLSIALFFPEPMRDCCGLNSLSLFPKLLLPSRQLYGSLLTA
jgi:hypothetical protein